MVLIALKIGVVALVRLLQTLSSQFIIVMIHWVKQCVYKLRDIPCGDSPTSVEKVEWHASQLKHVLTQVVSKKKRIIPDLPNDSLCRNRAGNCQNCRQFEKGLTISCFRFEISSFKQRCFCQWNFWRNILGINKLNSLSIDSVDTTSFLLCRSVFFDCLKHRRS